MDVDEVLVLVLVLVGVGNNVVQKLVEDEIDFASQFGGKRVSLRKLVEGRVDTIDLVEAIGYTHFHLIQVDVPGRSGVYNREHHHVVGL